MPPASASLPPLRQAIAAACRSDETSAVLALAGPLRFSEPALARIGERARALVAAVRQARRHASGVDRLMHEFSLASQEGIALMCLAEALLRIPDRDTADRLIRDQVGRGDWRAHLGHSPSLFVNAAAWGLVITRRLVATHSERNLGSALSRALARGGEPLVRKGVDLAMRLLGQQFVAGRTIAEALERGRAQEARGYRHSYDMLGEAALTAGDAARYLAAYTAAVHAIGQAAGGRGVHAAPGLSIKLSALHPRYVRAQRERVMAELRPRLGQLCALARQYGIGINIDAEESERLDLSLDLFEALALDPALGDWDGLGFVVQAYQKRCPFVIDHLIDLARRSGHRLMIRLVKGAYWDSEIKRAQVDGLAGYPVYTRKPHTDVAYLACAQKLLRAGPAVYPQFATHNAHSLAAVYQLALDLGVDDYEFQCLHGMGEALYDQVVGAGGLGKPCRIYAPVGSHESLLPYLVRRLLENGANSSFVNRLVDETVSIDELIADPVERVLAAGAPPHPSIPLPPALYGAARRNSAGLDLADEGQLARLDSELAALARRYWQAAPLLAPAGSEGPGGCGHASGDVAAPSPSPSRGGPGWGWVENSASVSITNPSERSDVVGNVSEATAADIASALAAAQAFAPRWRAVPAAERAAALERAADRFEAERSVFVSLCVREAGKTWANAIAEVREAVDFCRYYAQMIRAHGDAAGLAAGPVVCISPWNFPLAIFTGQVAAALAAGHAVIAKPAEQTPLIAAQAVHLLHQAGIPPAALQFLPGRGEAVGAALVADARVRGVLFTGSAEVAQRINRRLGQREAILIAETGGQNAMIVDSSALPEQVVQDVLSSAFDSAGQRCSALRVLCVQADIADRLLAMLEGAMQELRIGKPARLATDIGPVIDAEAQSMLRAHIERLAAAGKRIVQLPLPAECAGGSFVAPTLIEIGSIAELEGEVFGPVLHVLRFEYKGLDALIDAINATGYGLTLGLHTRLDETLARVAARAQVGNLYVNRNMVGAVVGVQPFGGEGQSGTGPKAGGPLYLHRLLGSRVVAPAALGLPRAAPAADRLTPLAALAAWAQAAGDTALAARCARLAETTLLDIRLALPGPTGESNTLAFAPRGTLLCLAAGEAGWLPQIAAALATGNAILLADSAAARDLVSRLPPAVSRRMRLVADWRREPVSAVLFAGEGEAAAALSAELAARDGALVPLLGADDGNPTGYPLHRLLVERVISINTAAAGGNAGLMALS